MGRLLSALGGDPNNPKCDGTVRENNHNHNHASLINNIIIIIIIAVVVVICVEKFPRLIIRIVIFEPRRLNISCKERKLCCIYICV